jgi:hypothetical protein
LSKLTVDVGGPQSAAVIHTNNTGALVNIKGIPVSARTKHIGVSTPSFFSGNGGKRYHRVRGEVERGAIDARYVATSENPADMFTKGLAKAAFQKFRAMIGIE